MRVPSAGTAAGMADLYEKDVVLDETPGKEELTSEVVSGLFADPVKRLHVLRFLREIDDRRRVELHARCQVVGLRTCGDVAVDGIPLAKLAIHFVEHLHLLVA